MGLGLFFVIVFLIPKYKKYYRAFCLFFFCCVLSVWFGFYQTQIQRFKLITYTDRHHIFLFMLGPHLIYIYVSVLCSYLFFIHTTILMDTHCTGLEIMSLNVSISL